MTNSAIFPVRREDVFVSLCFPEAPLTPEDVDIIAAATRVIAETFRYFEVLIIARIDQDADGLLRRCLQKCPNSRVIKVRGSSLHYSRRVVAASEAIGDVVVITSLSEVGSLDLTVLIATAIERNAVTVFTQQNRSWTTPILALLGAASRFRISANDMRTIALPRTWLNRLLAHPQHNLALRFPPLGEGFPIHHMPAGGLPPLKTIDSARGRRIGLLYQLSVNAAPVVLIGVGVLSATVVMGALLYMAYAVGALFLVANLQAGWFTTSIVQACTVCYLGLAILGLSMGLQKLLEYLAPRTHETIMEEMSNADLFADVQDLNISVDVERSHRLPGGTLDDPDRAPLKAYPVQ